jgi:hypothetical protein
LGRVYCFSFIKFKKNSNGGRVVVETGITGISFFAEEKKICAQATKEQGL